MTADCRDDKDIKKQFMRQNAVGNMLVRKFPFAPIEANIQLLMGKSYYCQFGEVILLLMGKSYCYPIYGYVLLRHSYQNSIRKLTVSFSDTFKRLINIVNCHAYHHSKLIDKWESKCYNICLEIIIDRIIF